MPNGGGGPSQKEKDVIEQQRKLAMIMGKKTKTSTASASAKRKQNETGTGTANPISAGGLKLVAAAPSKRPKLQQPKTVASLKPAPPSKPKPDVPPQKRPTVKRATMKKPASNLNSSTAAAILERARAKVAGSTEDEMSQSGGASTDSKSLASLKRKSANGSRISQLAKLVHTVASNTSNADGLSSTAFSHNTSPEDFWKNLREWDFVADLAKQRRPQNQEPSESDPIVPAHKPIPDTFINHRHYVAAWAPLCLAEARAQLLSEVMTECGQYARKPPLLLVNVETTWKGGPRNNRDQGFHTDLMSVDSCHIMIKTKHRGDGGHLQFFTHDICCLVPVPHKDLVERLLRGGHLTNNNNVQEAYHKFGMIGYTEVSRKEVNGLILKVSKQRWAKVGCPEMFLLKIGSNVTALREFTALCGVETTPLKSFLLGQHLDDGRSKQASKSSKAAAAGGKKELLKKMGGEKNLGKGFTEYAQHKFNPSQLTAISASAQGYGDGGFTLIKGPPGTGKTTTLVAILNALHIRQYNKYYEEVRRIAGMQTGNRQAALDMARRAKPRLLVCAPSNAAVDNVILKIMEDGFVDGSGQRYNPLMIRVGVGQSAAVRDVALETKVDQILSENLDIGQLESSIAAYRMELQRISGDIAHCRKRVHAIISAAPWPLSKNWEIRVHEETFDETGQVYFVNHKDQTTTYECPPPPEPGETQFHARSMPEHRAFMARIVKLVESYFSIKQNLERSTLVKGSLENGANHFAVRQSLEAHVLNAVHIVMTTLGTAGNRAFEGADKFEVVVVDEAAQCVEPATLSALQLGSRHSVLVGDPQQLPATIFNVSGKNTKYDRSLFQRLEESGQEVFMLEEQYRMHPKISHFPRHIFYGGSLLDGPNVTDPSYGKPLLQLISSKVPALKPFTVLDLDSQEERGGTSLSNSAEANLAVYLYKQLREITPVVTQSRVAVITPYSQQANLLRRSFEALLGKESTRFVEVNTVDAFQGREAKIVIFSAVRAAGSHGIGFLSDVRRMNVALTRAKHFLFVIARCQSIVVNPYWNDLVQHARETDAVVQVPIRGGPPSNPIFGPLKDFLPEGGRAPPPPPPQKPRAKNPPPPPLDPRMKSTGIPPPPPPPLDPRMKSTGAPPPPPPQALDPRMNSTGVPPPPPPPPFSSYKSTGPQPPLPPHDPRKMLAHPPPPPPPPPPPYDPRRKPKDPRKR